MEGAKAWVRTGDLVECGDEVTACLERLGVGGERHGWSVSGGRVGMILVEGDQRSQNLALRN